MATTMEIGAIERLTSLVESPDRYDYAAADLREAQIAAMNARFQDRVGKIKLLRHRAEEAGITEIRSLEEAVPLLLPHTAYKSYPESFLMEGKWDKLSKWLDSVSTHRVPAIAKDAVRDVDHWVETLQAGGHNVSCSSGTTGKSAMLVASNADMEWCKREAPQAYTWGSGVPLDRSRRIFGLAPVASVPRNAATGEAYVSTLQDPNSERFNYPVPPITVGSLTQMVVARKKIADGTIRPEELAEFERISAERAKAVEDAVGITAEALVAARGDKLHLTGLWSGLYNVAKAVRDSGYSAKDFNPKNSIYVGGGLKRANLPADYREFVYETFNIQPERNYQNYSMQELHSGMPRCQKGGRYHLPAWLVPLILDKSGDNLLPIAEGEYEGRAAFFDLSIDGRWGGVISGDKVSIDFSPCACGAKSPSIRDSIVRYADLEGDDKIGCAGTVDAYVRGLS
ncbi:hypothetical protein [Novosphingobium sp. JCM 18896]|uniref:hypothetical protein n=1 Tax=Novosphingobium sp. JCM 18896 TaxID=2989731 RepID=UPI0022215BB0|nr:hypothetical protein [Novosphingobium sp. JCM 18896]MCW1428947.1 hypothetical protein [Novosphingobium sp. JCM 18896]